MKSKMSRRTASCHYGCPIEAALDVIGSKWKGIILFHLLSGTKRFNELKRLLSGVTQRTLTLQLRELENDNVIIREVHATVPPKVEYSLSKFGQQLKPILHALRDWGSVIMEKEISRNLQKTSSRK